jgi:hypothetical protein
LGDWNWSAVKGCALHRTAHLSIRGDSSAPRGPTEPRSPVFASALDRSLSSSKAAHNSAFVAYFQCASHCSDISISDAIK